MLLKGFHGFLYWKGLDECLACNKCAVNVSVKDPQSQSSTSTSPALNIKELSFLMSMCEGPGGSYAGSAQDALTQLGAAPGMAGPIFPPGRPYNTLFSQSNKCKQKLQGCLKLSLKLGGHAVSAEMHSPGLSKPQGEPKCIRRGNIQFLFYGKSSKLTLQKGSA